MHVKEFIKKNFKHFNAAVIVEAAEGWIKHLKSGGKMFLTLAGALSTGEIGLTLAQMIRKGKIHAISSTGANLEEDLFNLVAHKSYKRIPSYRNLTSKEELELRKNRYNRITDTCIPEAEAIEKIEKQLYPVCKKAEEKKKRYFPYELIYQIIRKGALKAHYQIDPKNSWVIAACEKNIPIFTPGWEDSTLGNEVVANVRLGHLKSFNSIKDGLEQMNYLIDWYLKNTRRSSMGFFQIGGGIAGDFAICVVPLI